MEVVTLVSFSLVFIVLFRAKCSILGRGMKELKIGDRFWYENAGMKNSFTPG